MTGARPQLSRFRSLAFAGLTFAAALAIVPAHVHATNTVTIGGPWTLRAPDGATVTDKTYRGKWLLVFFGYTSCPNTCPMTLHEVSVALQTLGPHAEQVQPLFITVDPEHDTADVVKDYAASFDPRIVGLTGSAEEIAAAAKEYGVYYAAHVSATSTSSRIIDHSSYIYAMDPQGTFIRGFDAETSGEHIATTLRTLMK